MLGLREAICCKLPQLGRQCISGGACCGRRRDGGAVESFLLVYGGSGIDGAAIECSGLCQVPCGPDTTPQWCLWLLLRQNNFFLHTIDLDCRLCIVVA